MCAHKLQASFSHTIRLGGLGDGHRTDRSTAFQRDQETRLSKGTYVAKAERLTIAELAASLLKECKARSRRTSTVLNYSSVLDGYVLPKFGAWEAGTVRKSDVRSWLGELIESGKRIELVNRIVRVFKTLLFDGVVTWK